MFSSTQKKKAFSVWEATATKEKMSWIVNTSQAHPSFRGISNVHAFLNQIVKKSSNTKQKIHSTAALTYDVNADTTMSY